MNKIIPSVLLILSFLTGCSKTDDLRESAERLAEGFSRADSDILWEFVSPKEREALENQLASLKTSGEGKGLLISLLEIPEENIADLTAKDYFDATISVTAKVSEIEKIKITDIASDGNNATIKWETQNGVNSVNLFKEKGKWYMNTDQK